MSKLGPRSSAWSFSTATSKPSSTAQPSNRAILGIELYTNSIPKIYNRAPDSFRPPEGSANEPTKTAVPTKEPQKEAARSRRNSEQQNHSRTQGIAPEDEVSSVRTVPEHSTTPSSTRPKIKRYRLNPQDEKQVERLLSGEETEKSFDSHLSLPNAFSGMMGSSKRDNYTLKDLESRSRSHSADNGDVSGTRWESERRQDGGFARASTPYGNRKSVFVGSSRLEEVAKQQEERNRIAMELPFYPGFRSRRSSYSDSECSLENNEVCLEDVELGEDCGVILQGQDSTNRRNLENGERGLGMTEELNKSPSMAMETRNPREPEILVELPLDDELRMEQLGYSCMHPCYSNSPSTSEILLGKKEEKVVLQRKLGKRLGWIVPKEVKRSKDKTSKKNQKDSKTSARINLCLALIHKFAYCTYFLLHFLIFNHAMVFLLPLSVLFPSQI